MDTSLDGIKFRDSNGQMTEKLSLQECESRVKELAQSYFEKGIEIKALEQEQSQLKHQIIYLMKNHYAWSSFDCYVEVEHKGEIEHVLIQDSEDRRIRVSIPTIDYIR